MTAPAKSSLRGRGPVIEHWPIDIASVIARFRAEEELRQRQAELDATYTNARVLADCAHSLGLKPLLLDIAPVPVTGTIGLSVVLLRPPWFLELVEAIYAPPGP